MWNHIRMAAGLSHANSSKFNMMSAFRTVKHWWVRMEEEEEEEPQLNISELWQQTDLCTICVCMLFVSRKDLFFHWNCRKFWSKKWKTCTAKMSTNYIVTAQKPTAVTACVTGKLKTFHKIKEISTWVIGYVLHLL